MTTISAKPILGSIGPAGQKIASLELRYPRPIHAELMTHRAFSRNASSSRAIPVAKLIAEAIDDYAEPLHWGLNERGMQATTELTGEDLQFVKMEWHRARLYAIERAKDMASRNASKQLVNRILEPYTHITVIVTSTNWANFLKLREDAAAEPHIRILAGEVRKALETMFFKPLKPGMWHLPYVTENDRDEVCFDHGAGSNTLAFWEILQKVSTARCARVSYLNHDGTTPNIEADVQLYDRLCNSGTLHASPMEHQASPDQRFACRVLQTRANPEIRIPNDDGSFTIANEGAWNEEKWLKPELHGNLWGFIQYRKTLPGEAVHGFI